MSRVYNEVLQKDLEQNMNKLYDGPFQRDIRQSPTSHLEIMDNSDFIFFNISEGLKVIYFLFEGKKCMNDFDVKNFYRPMEIGIPFLSLLVFSRARVA